MDFYTIISGLFSCIFTAISLIVGFIIVSKYKKFKQKIYIHIGLTWIFISEPWWPSSVSFLIALFTGGDGLLSAPAIYFIIGNIFIPFTVILWLTAFTDLMYPKKQKIILLIFVIYGVIFEIFFFYFLVADISLIGILEGITDVTYKFLVQGYLLSIIIVLFITGFMFSRQSFKSDDPDIRLKGKLLALAFTLFTIGALLDSAIELNEITVIITRIILILSALCWYGGFILPRWMKEIFQKK